MTIFHNAGLGIDTSTCQDINQQGIVLIMTPIHRASAKTTKTPINPMWVSALFVSLTEAVVAFALPWAESNNQTALTWFVILFPVILLGMFSLVLWKRPYLLYSPRDFGSSTEAAAHVEVMRKATHDIQLTASEAQEMLARIQQLEFQGKAAYLNSFTQLQGELQTVAAEMNAQARRIKGRIMS